MPTYDVQLFKPTESHRSTYDLIGRIPFEAANDKEARHIAPMLPIPRLNDGDMALVFSPDHRPIWRL
jgi:hypothetical protein